MPNDDNIGVSFYIFFLVLYKPLGFLLIAAALGFLFGGGAGALVGIVIAIYLWLAVPYAK